MIWRLHDGKETLFHLGETQLFLVHWNIFPTGLPRKDSTQYRKHHSQEQPPQKHSRDFTPQGTARAGRQSSFIGEAVGGGQGCRAAGRLKGPVL